MHMYVYTHNLPDECVSTKRRVAENSLFFDSLRFV